MTEVREIRGEIRARVLKQVELEGLNHRIQ
jgi:hypothetical protein